MPRVVRAGLIQAGVGTGAPDDVQSLRRLMLEKHVELIQEAAGKGVEVLCLQELFTSPTFPQSSTTDGGSWGSRCRAVLRCD